MVDSRWLRLGSLAAVAGFVLAAASLGNPPQPASAQEPAQSGAPSAAAVARPLSPELDRLRSGLASAAAGDWIGLAVARDSASDPLVRKILQWRFAAATDAPLDFQPIADALDALPDWPGRATMKTRAQEAILQSSLTPAERIAFFDHIGGPSTSDGRIALASALRMNGRRADAQAMAREGWRSGAITPPARAEATANFTFTEDDYDAHVDQALWRGDVEEARRFVDRLTGADRLVARARIALQTRQRRGLQAAVDAVPAARRDSPGLLYDRAQYVRRTGRPENAINIAAQIDPTNAPANVRDDIYREKRLYVPRALRTGQVSLAYRLATDHGLTSGEDFADAEWLAGWIALRFQNNPQRAETHFAHLDANVSAPVSRARALYWRAEAERAQNDTANANAHLTAAAQYTYTYYGQLAAERMGGATLAFDGNPVVPADARARFEARELARALHLIAETGDRESFEAIAFYLDDTLDNAQELEALSQLAREQGYLRTAVRSAKAGIRRGVFAYNAAYPLLTLPPGATLPGRSEPALTLAIIRQESEFDSGAVSSARARGLMQLMPATARLQAARSGLSYSGPEALTADPDYNVTLGAAHLGDLVSDFGGSYVLAIAAYNAGSARTREWIGDWGDPRSSNVDVVDWIELIPFAETRNYVQRVMENLQVYRQRLSGQPTPITLDADLRRGRG